MKKFYFAVLFSAVVFSAIGQQKITDQISIPLYSQTKEGLVESPVILVHKGDEFNIEPNIIAKPQKTIFSKILKTVGITAIAYQSQQITQHYFSENKISGMQKTTNNNWLLPVGAAMTLTADRFLPKKNEQSFISYQLFNNKNQIVSASTIPINTKRKKILHIKDKVTEDGYLKVVFVNNLKKGIKNGLINISIIGGIYNKNANTDSKAIAAITQPVQQPKTIATMATVSSGVAAALETDYEQLIAAFNAAIADSNGNLNSQAVRDAVAALQSFYNNLNTTTLPDVTVTATKPSTNPTFPPLPGPTQPDPNAPVIPPPSIYIPPTSTPAPAPTPAPPDTTIKKTDTTQQPTCIAMAAAVNSIYSNFKGLSNVNQLASLASGNTESALSLGINHQNGSFVSSAIVPGDSTSSMPPGFPTNSGITCLASIHTHPVKGYDAPSPQDVYYTIQQYMKNSNYQATFVFDADGNKYALKIADPAAAVNFFNQYSYNYLITNNAFDINSFIGQFFSNALKAGLVLGEDKESAFANALSATLDHYDAGVELLKADSNGNFNAINMDMIYSPIEKTQILINTGCNNAASIL